MQTANSVGGKIGTPEQLSDLVENHAQLKKSQVKKGKDVPY